MNNLPDVTVSIVNWNTMDNLKECLSSLMSQKNIKYEIAVVDNASSDGTLDMLHNEFEGKIGVLPNSENIGFGAAHNIVAEASEATYILVLNPDTYVWEDDMLDKMTTYMDEHPNIAVLAPKILNPDGELQLSVRRFPSMIAGIFRQTSLEKLFPNNPFVRRYLMKDFRHDDTADVDWASGCAMLIRRSAMEDIGGFDERFFMYCEDMDLCKRLGEEGWRTVYFPEATVSHQIGASSDQDPIAMIDEHHRSMLKYFLKYNSCSPSILLLPFVMLGLAIRSRSLKKRVHI